MWTLLVKDQYVYSQNIFKYVPTKVLSFRKDLSQIDWVYN